MWQMSVPWWEFIIRCSIIYFFLLLLLRLSGKRQVGQMTSFDFVLLLVLANTVQNSMNAGDNSVTAGLISCSALIIINYLVSLITFNNKKLELFIEGKPEILIHNGVIYPEVMKHSKLTHHELMLALREAGCLDITEVHVAILENNGNITVTPMTKTPPLQNTNC